LLKQSIERYWQRIVFMVFQSALLVIWQPVFAQSLLPDYPDSKIEYQTELPEDKRLIVLSTPKRINNAISIEEKSQVKGVQSNTLLKLTDDNAKAAYDFYLKFFKKHGQLIYQCEKLACGSSNYWADQLFEEHRLYGRDNGQYYIAGKIKSGEQTSWVMLYFVQNGLRQNLAYISILAEEQKETNWDNGLLVDLNSLPKDIPFIKQTLAKNKHINLWIGVYSSNNFEMNNKAPSVSKAMAQLEEKANHLKDVLLKRYDFNSERIKINVVGPFHHDSTLNFKQAWFRFFLFDS